MTEWIAGILVSSVGMSLILKILPDNSIKRAAFTAFGIIFLLVTAYPVIDFFSDDFSIEYFDDFSTEKIPEVQEDSDDKYIESVVSEYCKNLSSEAEKLLLEETGKVCSVDVTVCEDIDSDYFGKVLRAECCVISDQEADSGDKSIVSDVPIIKDIVISLSKNDDKEDDFKSDDICEVLTDLFGITGEQCLIYAKEED